MAELIGSNKIDPITTCIFDSVAEIKITEKICKYILKFLFLLFNRNERGLKKIKAKIS